ncbi:MAG: hypothetical protein PXZ07_04310 [Candidatus Eremiobacteraeota bacterium]|nr:hypothetical protein [Candidatus Eremiobacteraeota bacterium]
MHQHVYEDAPASHQAKAGTPTMGGIIFAIAVLPLALDLQVPMLGEFLILVLGCAAIASATASGSRGASTIARS